MWQSIQVRADTGSRRSPDPSRSLRRPPAKFRLAYTREASRFGAPLASKGWRQFMEYGNGYTGDMGVHIFDMVRMMMDLGWPESVSATGGIYMRKEASANRTDTLHSMFHYKDLDVSWEHRMWGKSDITRRHWSDRWGARFIGEKGTLNVTSVEYKFSPDGTNFTEGRHLLSRTGDLENADYDEWGAWYDDFQSKHVMSFLKARENRGLPSADIVNGHISRSCCILANMSQQLGRSLRYDPASRTIIGDEEATGKLARPYRGNWVHPDPAAV